MRHLPVQDCRLRTAGVQISMTFNFFPPPLDTIEGGPLLVTDVAEPTEDINADDQGTLKLETTKGQR